MVAVLVQYHTAIIACEKIDILTLGWIAIFPFDLTYWKCECVAPNCYLNTLWAELGGTLYASTTYMEVGVRQKFIFHH